MTKGEWTRVVDEMVSRGAQGTEDELDNIIFYLSSNFGRSAAGNATAAAPVVNEKPLTESEIARGKELLTSKGCFSCHRMADTGSYVGPDLTTIGGRRSEEEIRAALVSPNKEVAPENRGVRLTTKDGKTITGRILGQDGFSVQLMDSNNQLRSFEKENLRQFAIVTTNPMKSYANQMSAKDLADLVRYLSSLQGNEQP